MICDWEKFKADAEKLFMKHLDDVLKNTELINVFNYSHIDSFISTTQKLLMKVLSHIGCKNVLSHSFYCNRLHDACGNVCNLCTR